MQVISIRLFTIQIVILTLLNSTVMNSQNSMAIPQVDLEIGGELFAKQTTESGNYMMGVAAVMIDIDLVFNEKVSLFGAFHFDSSPWHDLLNETRQTRMTESSPYDIELEVEEFYLTWNATRFLTVTAGRWFSRISPVNQLHLADFQFNMKPRIFTSYWGSNHGMAIDGIGTKLHYSTDNSELALKTEFAKNGIEKENTLFTNTLSYKHTNERTTINPRIFGYWEHQTTNHPFLALQDEENFKMRELRTGLKKNGWGGSLTISHNIRSNQSLLFTTEWMNRKYGSSNYPGAYAFLVYSPSENWSASIMYQQLKLPLATDGVGTINEKSIISGISWFPYTNHRLRLEYQHYGEKIYHENMLLMKYTFIFDI
ncbi:hypothetical protein [Natronoflexus pectinivorans]|uniref:Phosphate-selective porin O/P n=1 Tax=Natronoflexus pectinivorans TaxID=682526 RepID=A0A4R2GLB4_9BACT|nr:hypothetical protein [Natronoflexus pectinivorans]TCO09772.1 hypothetical protein EV194_102198 [Natronoflexus pectinivorans]